MPEARIVWRGFALNKRTVAMAHPKVGAITKAETVPPAGVPWHLHFQRVLRTVQVKFKLPETEGVAAVMKRYGYKITA